MSATSGQITLNTADATNDRIDLIVAENPSFANEVDREYNNSVDNELNLPLISKFLLLIFLHVRLNSNLNMNKI